MKCKFLFFIYRNLLGHVYQLAYVRGEGRIKVEVDKWVMKTLKFTNNFSFIRAFFTCFFPFATASIFIANKEKFPENVYMLILCGGSFQVNSRDKCLGLMGFSSDEATNFTNAFMCGASVCLLIWCKHKKNVAKKNFFIDFQPPPKRMKERGKSSDD